MVSLNTYNYLTCELSCLLTLQRFAAREMWSFHRSPSRHEPTVYFARPSRVRLHRSALTSLSTGCLAFGNLASGSQNLCLSQQQESTLCHKIIGVGTIECGRRQKRIRNIIATFQYGIERTQMTVSLMECSFVN